ncbi:MAG: PIN domain-containing protein [Candidatus Omnitrophica bacterium]|nr:PIN domain-containing protein [Candidatus Omnitrophota bacterium]
MNANIFFDTNVLVYARSFDLSEKQGIAIDYVEDGLRYGIGFVSTQVLSEFVSVMTRKIARPITLDIVKEELSGLEGLQLVEVDRRQILRAIDLSKEHVINYWDALILASAEKAGCRTLLTEDMAHGRKFGRIEVINPFLKAARR